MSQYIHLPLWALGEIKAAADRTPGVEVCGYIGYDVLGNIAVRFMDNVSEVPEANSVISGEAMRSLIEDELFRPYCIFHSHPSGNRQPAQDDLDFFPALYVSYGLVVPCGEQNMSGTLYSKDGPLMEIGL